MGNVLFGAQGKRAVFEERTQHRFVSADGEGCQLRLVEELIELAGCEVRQGIGVGVTLFR